MEITFNAIDGLGWANAATILGLTRILNEDQYQLTDTTITFDDSILNDFAEKYFDYFADTYRDQLTSTRILAYRGVINERQQTNYNKLTLDDYLDLQNYLDQLKKFARLATIKTVLQLHDSNFDAGEILKILPRLPKVNTENQLTQQYDDIVQKLRTIDATVLSILTTFEEPAIKRDLERKFAMYTFVNQIWDGIGPLSRTKEPDFIQNYHDAFIQSALDFLHDDKKRNDSFCFNCGRKITAKEHNKGTMLYLHGFGYDINRKLSNHYMLDKPDEVVCPLCKWFYTVVAAGFTFKGNSGLFINDNMSIKRLVNTNNQLMQAVNNNKNNQLSALSSFIRELTKKDSNLIPDHFKNVEVIENVDHLPHQSFFTASFINLIKSNPSDFRWLYTGIYQRNGAPQNVGEDVIRDIMANKHTYQYENKLLQEVTQESIKLQNTSALTHLTAINNNMQ